MQISMFGKAHGIILCIFNVRLEEENLKTQKLYKKEILKNTSLLAQVQELNVINESIKNELNIIRRNLGTGGINLEAIDQMKLTIKTLEQDIAKKVRRTFSELTGRSHPRE